MQKVKKSVVEKKNTKISELTTKDRLLYRDVLKPFYTKTKLLRVKPYIDKSVKNNISLRMIDYLIHEHKPRLILWDKNSVGTKMNMDNSYDYSHVEWVLEKPIGAQRHLDLLVEYKSMVQTHTKARFDSCKRVSKKNTGLIRFVVDDVIVETTLSQLNFFRWLLKIKFLDFIEKNRTQVIEIYNQHYHSKKSAFNTRIQTNGASKKSSKKTNKKKITS